jgi:alpha-methylacyl-CoA racemase
MSESEMAESKKGPLSGIRIIEMVGLGPGPFCAMMLADMGAEVIRIQSKGSKPTFPVLNTRFDVMARGRRSMAINLKKPGGVEALLKLIEQADGLIEGFRPGVMERLGLSPEICQARNPKLIYGRMTGWGQHGPLAQAAGHDLNYLALSGALHAMGQADAPPPIPLNLVADFGGGGMMLAFGIVCALLESKTSGKGQVIDAAMTDGSALLTAMFCGFRAGGLWNNQRHANFLDGAAHYYDNYRCADGKYVSIGAIEPQFYALLREKIGATDAAFDAQNDSKQWPALKEKIAAIFITKTRDEWCTLLEGTDACFAPVLDWDEAIAHPHNRARGTFIEIDGVNQPAPAPHFSRTHPPVPASVASADEHTVSILQDWGITPDHIAALQESGAI